MRKLFAIFLALSALCASAENAIRLTFYNGSTVDVFFDTDPSIHFSGDLVELTSETLRNTWEIEDVRSIKLVDIDTDASAIFDAHHTSQLIAVGDLILINEDWARVQLYSDSGVLLETQEDKDVLLDLQPRHPGVYIIKVSTINATNSYKIVRK